MNVIETNVINADRNNENVAFILSMPDKNIETNTETMIPIVQIKIQALPNDSTSTEFWTATAK